MNLAIWLIAYALTISIHILAARALFEEIDHE